MKKSLITIFAILMVNVQCFALVTTETSSSKYLEQHGYSSETVRIIDLNKSQINSVDATYKTSKENWEKVNYPKCCTEKRINFVRKVFMYLDPGLNDGTFGSHQIKPSVAPTDL